jgi:homoserine O-acetyltransferase
MNLSAAALAVVLAMTSTIALAADYPAPKQGDWVAKDFKFHGGEIMPALRLHYTTLGAPTGQPVLVLHGSGGSAASMLTPAFAGELFGPGQPLDAAKYYIIIPDSLGHGQSSKPSDGMKTGFPKYDYADMVDAQYRLVTEGLGVKHLRAVIGNSMGGMHAWIWGVKYPQAMDVLVPMAADAGDHPQRSGVSRRRLHHPAAHDEICHQCLSGRQRRRHARLPGTGSDHRPGRPDDRRAAGDGGGRRCQRLHLPMGSLA